LRRLIAAPTNAERCDEGVTGAGLARWSLVADDQTPDRSRGVYCAVVDEAHPLDALRDLCRRLLSPDGCPWDRAQTFETLRQYVIEEAYEVVDAIDSRDPAHLEAELGDLLFQIVFVAQLATDQGWFDIVDVCRGIHAKMVRRHPHVFGDVDAPTAADVARNWEQIKRSESGQRGALAGVPRQLPALLKALRMTEKAAAFGFDWERTDDVVAKLREEVEELADELRVERRERHPERVSDEMGDVLFVMANLARRLGVDPEAALQAANDKFTRRFSALERRAHERGRELQTMPLAELDGWWEEIKHEQRS
jgi:MazG family protein